MTMQQVRIDRTGGPDVLALVERPVPEPEPGQVRIRLEACGVNFIDIYQRTGLYPVPLPTGLGLEGAGVVDAVGEGVRRFAPGDRAAFCTGPLGAYANVTCIPEGRAVRVPNGLDLALVAGALLKGLTAEFLVRRLRPLGAGDTVLFHAAAGGVGLIACSWLESLGVRVIGTAGSAEKAALARAHGCAHTILYREEDVAARVREITGGEGCAVVFDSVGATTLTGSLDSAARRGLVVSFGNASGPPAPVAPLDLSRRGSLFLTRPTLFDYVSTTTDLDAAAQALFAAMADGAVRPLIGSRLPLSAAAEAHRALEARETVGATILVP
jgi:NADPH2:quinone reductase